MINIYNSKDYVTIKFDNLSLLAADSLQCDNNEVIDFSSQDFVIPETSSNPDFYKKWESKFRSFYSESLPSLIEKIKQEYPGDGSAGYNKTVKARAFDILRGFLPAGFATNVAWTGSIDSVNKHLRKLLGHPLKEVRDLAYITYEKLKVDYPHSFRDLVDSDYEPSKYFYGFSKTNKNKFSSTYFEKSGDYDKKNPFYNFPQIQCDLLLDFASWRDLQRHRNMSYLMPLLSTDLGFHDFYLYNLPEDIKSIANNLLTEFCSEFSDISDSKEDKQYAVPMGFYCPVILQCSIHQAVYLTELRSGKTTHPTLRYIAQELGRFLKYQFDISCNIDYSEDNWTLKRGTQDIIKT